MAKKLSPKTWEKKEKPPRAIAEIEVEFKQACEALGSTNYQIESLKGKENALRLRINELVQENQKRQALDAKEKEEASVKPSEG